MNADPARLVVLYSGIFRRKKKMFNRIVNRTSMPHNLRRLLAKAVGNGFFFLRR